jgi:hypothetical protein
MSAAALDSHPPTPSKKGSCTESLRRLLSAPNFHEPAFVGGELRRHGIDDSEIELSLGEARHFHKPALIVGEMRRGNFDNAEIEIALDELLTLRYDRPWIEGCQSEWCWILPTRGAHLASWRAKVGPNVRARLADASIHNSKMRGPHR